MLVKSVNLPAQQWSSQSANPSQFVLLLEEGVLLCQICCKFKQVVDLRTS